MNVWSNLYKLYKMSEKSEKCSSVVQMSCFVWPAVRYLIHTEIKQRKNSILTSEEMEPEDVFSNNFSVYNQKTALKWQTKWHILLWQVLWLLSLHFELWCLLECMLDKQHTRLMVNMSMWLLFVCNSLCSNENMPRLVTTANSGVYPLNIPLIST